MKEHIFFFCLLSHLFFCEQGKWRKKISPVSDILHCYREWEEHKSLEQKAAHSRGMQMPVQTCNSHSQLLDSVWLLVTLTDLYVSGSSVNLCCWTLRQGEVKPHLHIQIGLSPFLCNLDMGRLGGFLVTQGKSLKIIYFAALYFPLFVLFSMCYMIAHISKKSLGNRNYPAITMTWHLSWTFMNIYGCSH